MKRIPYIEKYHRLMAKSGGVHRLDMHQSLMPQLQRVFESGVDSGMDPLSLDPSVDNPHHRGRSLHREAWAMGWMIGAEMMEVRP